VSHHCATNEFRNTSTLMAMPVARRRRRSDSVGDLPPSSNPSIPITSPGVLDAVASPINLQIWECVRRFRRPATIAEIQASARLPIAQVQASIDLLHHAGLVDLIPASREHRTIRWKTTREQILLTYRRDLPEEELLQQRMQQLFDHAQRELRAKVKPRAVRTSRDFHWNSIDASQLTNAEVNDIYEMLQKIVAIAHRANARVASLDPTAKVDSNYLIAIDVEPLTEGVLPLPTMQCLGNAKDVAAHAQFGTDAEELLSARERDVAQRLAAGASRAEVSRQLGISPHTVTEFTRRIYRKLGVNNRARLATKLASGT